MATAFVSPFVNDTNQYIEIHKRLLSKAGYEVKPLSFRLLFSRQVLHLFDRKNLLVFHWIETRPFLWIKAHPRYSLQGWLQWLIYFGAACVSTARVAYFLHDHAVHDTDGFKRKVSTSIIRLFAWVSTVRVVHDPSFCQAYKAVYLPHPLYWDDGRTDSTLPHQHTARHNSELRCGILGAIRPYKNIDKVLKHWPKACRLVVKGRGADDYVANLQSIIASRELQQQVTVQSGFLSAEAFNEALDNLDVLILPHQVDSMLVSGSFFEGIGRVPVILARRSPFIDWVASQSSSVIAFANDQDIPAALEKARQVLQSNGMQMARAFAIAEFGWSHCQERYAQALAFKPRP